jgi:hypothetical protein
MAVLETMESLGWIPSAACDNNQASLTRAECDVFEVPLAVGGGEGAQWVKRVTKVNLNGGVRKLAAVSLETFRGLATLKSIAFADVQVFGDISVLAELTELETFSARLISGITGDVAAFRNMPYLKSIDIAGTSIFGSVNTFQGKHMTAFDVTGLNVTGPLRIFRGMHDMTKFNIANTGIAGDIEILQGMQKLEALNAANCSMIRGDLDSLQRMSDMRFLVLLGTKVVGDISKLNLLHRLRYVDMHGLAITGSVEVITSMLQLTFLNLSNTQVGGWLSAFAESTKLTELYIYRTNIQGALGDLQSLVNLRTLRISNTLVGGSLGSIIDMPKLRVAILSDCFLEGELPNLDGTQLEILDVENNALYGRALPRLPQTMRHLNLRGNNLFARESSIRIVLAANLRYLSLANNAMDKVELFVEIERSGAVGQATTLDFRGAGIKCPYPDSFSQDGVFVFRDACEYDFVPLLIIVAVVTGAMVVSGVLIKYQGAAVLSNISRRASYHADANSTENTSTASALVPYFRGAFAIIGSFDVITDIWMCNRMMSTIDALKKPCDALNDSSIFLWTDPGANSVFTSGRELGCHQVLPDAAFSFATYRRELLLPSCGFGADVVRDREVNFQGLCQELSCNYDEANYECEAAHTPNDDTIAIFYVLVQCALVLLLNIELVLPLPPPPVYLFLSWMNQQLFDA